MEQIDNYNWLFHKQFYWKHKINNNIMALLFQYKILCVE